MVSAIWQIHILDHGGAEAEFEMPGFQTQKKITVSKLFKIFLSHFVGLMGLVSIFLWRSIWNS